MKKNNLKNVINGRVLSADGAPILPPVIINTTPLLESLKTQLAAAISSQIGYQTRANNHKSDPLGPAAQNQADALNPVISALTAQVAAEQKNIENANTASQKAYDAQTAAQQATQNFQIANNPVTQQLKTQADANAASLASQASLAIANLNAQTSITSTALNNKKYIIIGSIAAGVIIITVAIIYFVRKGKGA